jgi:hypothetical protein
MIYGFEYENSGWGNEDELERARWDAKHDFPPTGHKALLYSGNQPACLIAAYEHGETEDEMLSLLRAHIVECTNCGSTAGTVQTDRLYLNLAAVCCESGNLYTPSPRGVNLQPQTHKRRKHATNESTEANVAESSGWASRHEARDDSPGKTGGDPQEPPP